MTTAQDQQIRELLPCPFCGREAMMSHSRDGEVCNVRCAGWSVGNCLGAGPNCYTEAAAVAGWNSRAPAVQAARALPAPTCCENGPPGGVCTECQEASAAYQWDMSPRRALPAGAEPAGEVLLFGGDYKEVSWRKGKMPPVGAKLYTAAQVLAMGRVPPGCVAVERKILEDASESLGNFVSDHGWGDSDMAAADNLSAVLAAAPRPPAAQKRYRLLVRNVDTIRADDEFLRDADSTWRIDPCGIFVGMPYMSNALLPARRAIEPTP